MSHVPIKKGGGHNQWRTAPSYRDGIALLLVLWVLTILMVIVLSFSYTARTETLSARSFKEGIERKFLAEAGMQRGVVEIFYRVQNLSAVDIDFWKTDGTAYIDQLGDGSYTVKITDEGGKIDLNMLTDNSGIILKNLLLNVGVKDEDTNIIVDSVLDWKDKNVGMHRLNGAGDDYYMSLPTPYKVKHDNFATVEELLMIKGMTPAILYGDGEKKGIIDFLTVYSRLPSININAAPKEVLAAIPYITPEIADAIINYRENTKILNPQDVGIQAQSLPFITLQDSNTFTIESIGQKGDESKGYASKGTIVINPSAAAKYIFLYYRSPVDIQ